MLNLSCHGSNLGFLIDIKKIMILRDHSIISHIQFGLNSEGKILFFPIWSYVEGWLSKEQILSSNNSITHVVLGQSESKLGLVVILIFQIK